MNKLKYLGAFLIVLIFGLVISFVDYTPEKSYAGLTIYEPPSIAIDMQDEYIDDYIRQLWKISKKDWTPAIKMKKRNPNLKLK